MLILSMIATVPMASYAEADTDKAIESKTTETATVTQKTMSYPELSQLVLKNSTTLESLKDSYQSILNGLDAYDGVGMYSGARNLGMGTTGNREGLYYQYAKPVLITKANLEAQAAQVEQSIGKMETTLNYQLQKMLIDLGSYNDQLELYTAKVQSLKTKYNHTKLKYDKGLISKLELATTENTLRQAEISVTKLNAQIKNYRTQISQLAALKPGIEYTFEVPVDSSNDFSISQFETYLQMAKQSSKTIAVENAKMAAIQNEQEVTDMYKSFMFKSDLLDFERRKEAQKNSSELAESTVHRTLLDLLNQLEDSRSDVVNAKNALGIQQMGYDGAVVMLKNKTILASDLIEYELSLNSAQLSLEQKQTAFNALTKKVDAFISYGVYIEGGQ